jgi:hypothetical protein
MAQAYLLQIAAGARLEWYSEQGYLGFKLDGRIVLHGTALAELRSANLLDCTPQGNGLPMHCTLSSQGIELAQTLGVGSVELFPPISDLTE